MIVDKLVVLAVAIICITYLSIVFIKRSKKLNIIVIALAVFCLGVYIASNIYNMKISIIVEGVILTFMIFIPAICVLFQFGGFKIKDKFSKFNGNIKYKFKKYDKAIEYYSKSKNMDNKSLYRLAMSYYKVDEYTKAYENFEKIVEEDDDYEAYFYMGNCLEHLKEEDSAIEKYKKCLELKEDYYEALEALSLIYSNKADFDSAIIMYDEILKFYPKMYEANFNKAIIYMNYRNFDEAMICYQKALDENPKLISARYNIGQIAFLKGDYQKAIDNFDIVKEDETYKIRSQYYLAKAYSILKNTEKAKEYLKLVMDKDESYVAQAREEVIFYDIKDYIESYINKKLNGEEDEAEDVKEKPIAKNKNGVRFINKFYRD